jgi:alkanesulfonate monooxygenase SsuD/methylene tetrahydromethanopterin reductase-like flavin-dependent oxidoreductase (luciferase family)
VRLGTGFFGAGSTPTAAFTAQVGIVREALAEAGRTQQDFSIAKRVYIGVDENGPAVRKRMNAALESIYGRRIESTEAAAVAGTAAECVRALREVAAAGAELILFTPLFDQAEQNERLAAEVMPQLG